MEETTVIQEEPQIKRVKPFDKRIHEIDFVRGVLIILVIMDHLFWCLKAYNLTWYNRTNIEAFNTIYQIFNFYWTSVARRIIQPLCLMAFCFVSGISCSFSKNNLKRGILAAGVWAIISIGSNVLQILIDQGWLTIINGVLRVDFDIISVLAVSILLYCIVEKKTWRSILATVLIMFLFTSFIVPMLRQSLAIYGGFTTTRPGGYYGENGTPTFYMPIFWEPQNQADYVPLLPYSMFFFLGALLSYFIYKERKQSIIKKKGNWERPICFFGRHTLIIYITHFFLLEGLFALIGLFIK